MARTAKPVTLHHPTLAEVSEAVPAADVEAWLAAGWRKGVTKAATPPTEEPLTGPDGQPGETPAATI